ncbi:hypothetical protein LPB85_12845 [Chryseobacterium sp. LC2016-27]|uniref:hypothetical protein n=1 Tax=Chryseobacterium sp. LC2016-27 TaxID=2897326 RepID=UPI001E2CDA22|nr:hypothetical protein [Chryseobacterium sp. LC2016-27]MCD0456325.1 hypothetical protein [Chryseobacterium sp. LC2016-27]
MKVAYHFKCGDISVRYDTIFYTLIFNKLFRLNEPFISSKILIGDLLISNYFKKNERPHDHLNFLFQVKGDIWNRIIPEKKDYFIKDSVFIICFETISRELATKLHDSLIEEERYLGALEIDNSFELHWVLYGESIGPKFRLLNKEVNIFIDNDDPENLEYFEDVKERFKGIPFERINIEYSNYRHSIFDDRHNFENAKRATEWKKGMDSIFATISDEIISKLTDTAPELTDKLWSINQTFLNAQTGEQYAQAMTSCRRVFEYVTDCLFPATNEIIEGHSLKKDKYKNRLLEFAKREFKSETNIDLIVTNTASLFEEWNKLYELSNKGVHSEPHRQECRRCIIRTILLLDDLIAIKRTAFATNIIGENFINDLRDKYDNNV